MCEIRVNGIVEESIVDGPGIRYVIFTQGCPHGCPGCHNPETHPPDGGQMLDVGAILDQFGENPLLAGITFSGGEPFLQAESLCIIGRAVKKVGKTLVVYTGFTLEGLAAIAVDNDAVRELLLLADILIDGPYVESLRDLQLEMRGSSNQRILVAGQIKKALSEGWNIGKEPPSEAFSVAS